MRADFEQSQVQVQEEPVTEVCSLLGMTNYCARLIAGYATITKPLPAPTHKNRTWEWTDKQEHALAQLKHVLASAPVTAYFNPEQTSEISVHASLIGFWCHLRTTRSHHRSQANHCVRQPLSLTTTKQRYSQTERKALTVVWACKHFHLSPTQIISHSLLSMATQPQNHLLLLKDGCSSFNHTRLLCITERAKIILYADYMSRHPSNHPEPCSRQEKVAEEYIKYIARTSTQVALTFSMIAEATGHDPTLRAVKDGVQSGKWYKLAKHPKVNADTFHTYERLKDELTIGTTTRVLIRGMNLVIPNKLQRRIMDLAHKGHQGITKTKSLLQEVWFPGINKMVEERVKSCLACQVATPEAACEPLKMSPLPDQAWEEISIDFASTGDYLLVLSDDYSRNPIVEVVCLLAAQTVIPKLQHIFSQSGIPGVL